MDLRLPLTYLPPIPPGLTACNNNALVRKTTDQSLLYFNEDNEFAHDRVTARSIAYVGDTHGRKNFISTHFKLPIG